MCGICGIFDANNPVITTDILLKMRDVMISRGPDDAGVYIGSHIGMGHRRLSILDISSAGHQPMHNEDEAVWIAFNGEIYNFRELRESLSASGHIFKSNTDTEVLIHGYEEWGINELLKKLNGMFAFAIWNSKTGELVLARDRLGIKPLFYMQTQGKVFFSSDIKSIYLACGNSLTIDPCAIDDFLYFYCIPQERSIFKEIRKVQPASYIVFKKTGSSSRQYWHLKFNDKLSLNEQDCLDELQTRLIAAVKHRMISDVPIGAFLSGGVDSSLVVAIMATLSSTPVKTFSMGVREESFNELKYARMVAAKYSTDHHEFMVEPEALNILPRIIWAYGEPFADASQIPVYYVSKMIRKHVTVALTGDGGDESFCGYGNSAAYYFSDWYRRHIPSYFRNTVSPILADSLIYVTGRRGIASKLKTLSEYGKGDFRGSLDAGGIFCSAHREKIYSEEFKNDLLSHSPSDIFDRYLETADGTNEVDKALYIGIKTSLPNDYLTKVDVATMMNSLEARSPYLDYELMEFAARVPASLKVKHGRQKYLLKKLASRFVPHEAIYRKKWGFGIPVGYWFRGGLKHMLFSILLNGRLAGRGYFNIDYVRQLIDEHLAEKADHTYRLWTLLCLEIWHLIFIDGIISESDELH